MGIKKLTCENCAVGCVTDNPAPVFEFYAESDEPSVNLVKAELSCNGWTADVKDLPRIRYAGKALLPYTEYKACLTMEDNFGNKAEKEISFETGKLSEGWTAKWITDGSYVFKEKKTSPLPMKFKKILSLTKKVKSVKLYATAIGIYEAEWNGKKIGKDFFAPGFTSYKTNLQYQTYDLTEMVTGKDELSFTVGGGWAVGSFVFTRVNRVTAKRQALLAEVRIVYEDGSAEVIATDESWQVTTQGKLRYAEFYDGVVYDATVDEEKIEWKNASIEKVTIRPQIKATYGSLVTAHEVFRPVSVTKAKSGEIIYDFGQNFAGVVRFKVKGRAGQKITLRHAEILTNEGELNVHFLRSAKASVVYTCKEGEQEYMPSMTYMGFRYAGISGVEEEDIEVEGVALYSELGENGHFTCSDPLINRLQQNVVWGGKSNFVEIPTDCPQRDERMGWTGDIAVFAPTACYNFDMSRFLKKWLIDVKAEQTIHGGIPNTVPVQGYGFPATMPKKAVAFWGDACVFVPWAIYMATGEKEVLKEMFPVMKKYLKACTFWAKLFSVGKNRYIWNDLPAMQFGDWVAPDVPQMGQWQARCKWTGTAAIARSAQITSQVAHILGETEDELFYGELSRKTADAYVTKLMDENGKLIGQEFQTGYVLPLHFNMFTEEEGKKKAAKNLADMIEKNDYCIGTGFPGTPYILFALADNGYQDVAFKMLTNTRCPSWLYEVKVGATTVWERWDGLNEEGVCEIGNDGTDAMVSYNHYASGAVGDFLYKRIAGIEATEGGYKTFTIAPLVGGGITSVQADVLCPYGKIVSQWQVEDGAFTLNVQVPLGTSCKVVLPSGRHTIVSSGKYSFTEKI